MASDATFEVIERIQTAQDVFVLRDILTSYLKSLGVETICYLRYAGVVGKEASGGVTVVATGFPPGLVDRYIAKKLYAVDPGPQYARQVRHPFRWSECLAHLRLTEPQQNYVSALHAAGVTEGVSMHLIGPDLRNAYLALGLTKSAYASLTEVRMNEFQTVAQVGHLRYCHLVDAYQGLNSELAPREREILHWVVRGKSNAAIATILELSPHTIDTVLRRLFGKLNVNNRTSAAIKGVAMGMVLPE